MAKIQRPTVGRIVEFLFKKTTDNDDDPCVYAGIVTHVHDPYDVVDIAAFNSNAVHFFQCVPYGGEKPGTWRYPARCTDEVETSS
jgi:hypothetical protein